MKPWMVAVAGLLTLTRPEPVRAQSDWPSEAQARLAEEGRRLSAAGYEMIDDLYIGELNDQTADSVRFTAPRTAQYKIVGICDDGCEDLDLVLYGMNGSRLGLDINPNNPAPQVDVTLSGRREVWFEVRMFCRAQPCGYGVGVFMKKR